MGQWELETATAHGAVAQIDAYKDQLLSTHVSTASRCGVRTEQPEDEQR